MPSPQSGNVDNFLPLFGEKIDSLTFLYLVVLYFDLRKEGSLINWLGSCLLTLVMAVGLAIAREPLTSKECAWFVVAFLAILELSDIGTALRDIKGKMK